MIANLVPLYGVFFEGWDPFQLLLLYWFESAVLGILNIPRILLASAPQGGTSSAGAILGKVFMAGFFTIHYGFFMAGHLAFLVMLCGAGGMLGPSDVPSFVHGTLASTPSLWFPVFSLAGSHLVSFLLNDIGRHEYRDTNAAQAMFSVYGRIFAMHIVLLFGGFLLTLVRAPALLVGGLVLFKIPMDVILHMKAHSPERRASSRGIPPRSTPTDHLGGSSVEEGSRL
jgi:hypothetical protein